MQPEEIGSLVTALEEAIAKGNVPLATEMAEKLSKTHAKVMIHLISVGVPPPSHQWFRLNVKLESADQKAPDVTVPLQVSPLITVYGLKVKMAILYGIPIKCQRWIVGKMIPKDTDSLKQLKILKPTQVFLYVLEPKVKKLDRGEISSEFDDLKRFHDDLLTRGSNTDLAMTAHEFNQYLKGRRRAQNGGASAAQRPTAQSPGTMPRGPTVTTGSDHVIEFNGGQGNEGVPLDLDGDFSDGMQRGHGDDLPERLFHTVPRPPKPRNRTFVLPPLPPKPRKPTAIDVGWNCKQCTFKNPPIIPACRTCLDDRPKDYKIPEPGTYVMDKDEERIFLEMEQNEMLLEEWQEEEKQEQERQAIMNLATMMQVAEQNLVTNTEPFDCPVCFGEIEPEEGVKLRECLHDICRECLENHINICNEPEVTCPYTEEGNDCEQIIPDREIRQIISEADYNRYLQRGLNRAEAAAADAFHCKSPDCVGLCFYDDEINFFNCEVCGHQNCLTCKALHEGQNCKQYQEELKVKAGNDEAAKKTHEALQQMVQNGEAMNCPKCGIIIQKKSGCDWMQCSVCKVEICWVTKGPRWGPKGHGDTSGGCKCNFQGQRCHPRCGNCH